MQTPLLDDDGENRAVRWFLAAYGGSKGMAIGTMKTHLENCGYPFWPEWCNTEHQDMHLTKGGAQLWLRHLFDLEKTDAEIRDALRTLADERNMVSDLIMSEEGEWLNCVFAAHDAQSFWAAVRAAHAALSDNASLTGAPRQTYRSEPAYQASGRNVS